MPNDLVERYNDIQSSLRRLFDELAALRAEKQRLVKENAKLRDEVSLLRLYIDAHVNNNYGDTPPPERDVLELTAKGDDAADFFEMLPETTSFAEILEIASVMDMSTDKVRLYLKQYLADNRLRRRGSHLEKTNLSLKPL